MLKHLFFRLAARRSLRFLLQSPHKALEIAGSAPLPRSPPERSAHSFPPCPPPQPMGRDWLARLWAEDKRAVAKKVERRGGERWRSLVLWDPFFGSSSHRKGKSGVPSGERLRSGGGVEDVYLRRRSGASTLLPTSPEEAKTAPLLGRSDLVIIRDIEWANLMFAFEQESRYNILDPHHPHSPVGSIHEQSNVISRQLLRTRRPFIAYVFGPHGDEIFRVRRPFWWINSTIYVEVDGKEIGVVHRRWHLWKRIYDLYLGNRQFAVVENPGFWNWTFTLKDENEKVLAEINRNWRGFGFELFTDAGQYVIRFGLPDPLGTSSPHIEELETERPLTLSERAIAVALAMSLDCDYFSRHGGWGMPLFIAGE